MITTITAETPAPKKPNSEEFESFLRKARERFKLCAESESEIRKEALDDMNFRAGEQWPQQIKAERVSTQRPCLTINRLPQFLKQVVNEQRQNRPSIQVNPVDNDDVDTAEVIQGLTRHIEINSNAEIAYDTAFDHAATMGFGYFRVITDYQDEQSFDQEIVIKRVLNPFTVYIDPACQEPDYSDMRFAFIVEDLTKEEFRDQYPNSELAGLTDFSSIGDDRSGWFPDGKVRVAEYFHVETETKTLCLLPDNSRVFKEDVPEGVEIVKTRETEVRRVKWAKINAKEKLEEADWAGKWIPIIPVLGDEIIVDGKRQLVGIVRYAKDPQRMYNYMRSAITEAIALAPKAPFVAAEGQLEGHERQWQSSNTRNIAALTYKPQAVNGTLVPAPYRSQAEPPIQAMSVALSQSSADLMATTGIHEASLGANGPEVSGRAILARQKQGDTANFNLIDNLSRSIKHLGRVLIDLIPHIYDAPRVARIVKPDNTHKTIAINQPFEENGIQKIYDLTTGRYDVTITVGPSYQSKRQEAVASMVELIKADPAVLQIAGDLFVRNMDWPGSQEIADRIKKTLPPQLQDDPEGKQPIPPQVQQQLAASGQMIDNLTKVVHQLQDEIDTKKVEMESRERIVAMQEETKRTIALANINSEEGLALLEHEIASLNTKYNRVHEMVMAGAQQDHQAGLQDAAQQHQAEQAAVAQEAAAVQQQGAAE